MDEIIYNIKIKDEAFWLLVLFLFTKIHMNIIINFDVEFSVPQGNSCSEKRLRLGRQRHVPLSVFLFFFFPKSLIQKVEKKHQTNKRMKFQNHESSLPVSRNHHMFSPLLQ